METRHILHRRMWLVAALATLSVMGGIGLGRIEPSGRKAGLLQFDAITELNLEWGFTNTVVFARYWVCRDYYAIAVVWCEPHGDGLMSFWRTLVVLSDKTGFRIADERYPEYTVVNTTYLKPIGGRGAFAPGRDGIARLADARFAEARAAARRVYVSDLATLKDPNQNTDRVVDLKVPPIVDGVKRELAQLKVNAKGDRIESMDLLDRWETSLCRIKYEYEGAGNTSALTKLVAELPAGFVKEAVDVNVPIQFVSGSKVYTRKHKVADIDRAYHKGGRTCTVTYKDVTMADQALRLPAMVEVRDSQDERPVRSARLVNFKHVDLDKTAVWEVAKAFAGQSREDREGRRLLDRYAYWRPKPGPMRVDPNDLAFVRRLIAKYPVPGPSEPSSEIRIEPDDPKERAKLRLKEARAKKQEREERVRNPPKIARLDIEPNDLRVIRQLRAYYDETAFVPITLAQRAEGGMIHRPIVEGKDEAASLHERLCRIVSYHRTPTLPEDAPPPIDSNDLELIRRLQGHYEALATQEDRGFAGRLKAIEMLSWLDVVLKDYDAFEAHTVRYLQMLQDGGLMNMYMAGGYNNLARLARAGRYDKANKLMRQWADASAAGNGPDAVYCFVGWDLYGHRSPWAGLQLLDRFLRKPGLSPMQRYEGLALRAIALDKIDRWLANPQAVEDEEREAQIQWILSNTSRQALARRVEPALREAVSAWQALGPARLTDAKPYSTANGFDIAGGGTGKGHGNSMAEMLADLIEVKNSLPKFVEATRLQETSFLLDGIVRQRMSQPISQQPKTRR
jgi:hypothetical protein